MLQRSQFRAAIVTTVAAVGVIAAVMNSSGLEARTADTKEAGVLAGATATDPADNWLKGLNGQHRQLFDSPAPAGGIPLVHIMNFLDTYNKAYNVADNKLNTIGTFYGSTTFYGLSDAMWAKYKLTDFLKGMGVDAGTGSTANPWRSEPKIMGMALAPASIESLQKRGTRFILCNNALSIFAGLVAGSQGLQADAVYADMKANILPGVELVPAMVVAIEQGHRAGLAYHRQ